jgi:hypothetical protein
MTGTVRRAAGTRLSVEAKRQLRALADLPDSEIDCSDIPDSSPEQLRRFRRKYPSAANATPELEETSQLS